MYHCAGNFFALVCLLFYRNIQRFSRNNSDFYEIIVCGLTTSPSRGKYRTASHDQSTRTGTPNVRTLITG
jgi:hypothetical protein